MAQTERIITVNQSDNIPGLITDLIVPERDGGYSKGRETREMILLAALSILIDEGYRAMSMRRVAAACGMKFGNLTYHYRTREDLVRELLDAVIRSYEQEFDAIVHSPGHSPEQRLERYCLLVLNDITTRKTTRLFPELWALSNHAPFVYDRMMLTLFISYSMEGSTIFAGHDKPFTSQMGCLMEVSIEAFKALVRDFKRQ